ncbi:MAG: SDR family oxidoreductase [Halioglobus sp.]
MAALTRYGTTALVTGASSGIGKAYARAIARDGMHLVLVARRKALLDELASELAQAYNIEVHTIAQDLSAADAADRVYDKVQEAGLQIDLLVNNAGFGTHGVFDELDLERELQMINLSCRLPVALTHKFLGGMKSRNRGAVVFLSSMAGTMPVPFMSTYCATKVFPRFFAESLYGELSGTGIDVLAVLPGDTSTEFRETADLTNAFPIPARSAEDVVQTTFGALGRAPSVIDGVANKVSAVLMGFMPKKALLKMNARLWKVASAG